jgi:hypothetical protein
VNIGNMRVGVERVGLNGKAWYGSWGGGEGAREKGGGGGEERERAMN